MTKRILNLVIALTFASSTVVAADNSWQLKCSTLLSSAVSATQRTSVKLKEKAQAYGAEVKSTRGLRLVLKDSPEIQEATKWGGLVTYSEPSLRSGISGYLSSILQFVPKKIGEYVWGNQNYRFTPFRGVYNRAVRNPIRSVSQRYLGRQKDLTALVHFPLVIMLSMLAYAQVDAVYSGALHNQVEAQISTYANEYDSAIQSDFRFNRVKQLLVTGKITKEDARREAYLISLAYTQYYKYRDTNGEASTLQSEMDLINHYLFAHLKKVVQDGVSEADGFYIPQSAIGKISDEQTLRLFEVNHLLYLKYQLIIEMVSGNGSLLNAASNNSKVSDIINDIMSDPFYRTLYELHEQKRISADQFQSLLQENVYWQTKFLEWQIVGVTKLKKVNGQYTSEPLTISDIQSEMLGSVSGRYLKMLWIEHQPAAAS